VEKSRVGESLLGLASLVVIERCELDRG